MESTGRVSRSLTDGGPNSPPRGGMTPDARFGSHFFCVLLLAISGSCSARTEAQPASERPADPVPQPAKATAKPAVAESCLGVADKGVFGDLDDKVQLALPAVKA